MSDTSGPTFYAPLGKWDRDSQSWKTSEATSLWALTLSSLTLPIWGGLHDGELCEHPTPELATNVPDSSSSLTPMSKEFLPTPRVGGMDSDRGVGSRDDTNLAAVVPRIVKGTVALPTPTSRDWKGPNQRGDDTCLTGALLPTPTSQAAKHGELSPVERQGNRPQDNGNLWVVMPRLAEEALLPTPAVNDMGEGKTLEWWDDWAPRQKSSDGRPAPHGRSLAIEAQRLLPTPATANSKSTRAMTASTENGRRSGGGQSSPPGLEEMASILSGHWPDHMPPMEELPPATLRSIGATTPQPSPDGNTSPDDPHPHQLSLDVQGIPA